MKVMILIAWTAMLLSAGEKTNGNAAHPMEMTGMSHDNHAEIAAIADNEAADKVQAIFTLPSKHPEAKQDTVIAVQIRDAEGQPVKYFDMEHERQMHMMIVSKDLSFFSHIHPEYNGEGLFTVTASFPTGGEFGIIADFAPAGMSPMSRMKWITVQGEAPAAKAVEPDASLRRVVAEKEVTLSFDYLRAKEEVTLNFNIKDAWTKKPVDRFRALSGRSRPCCDFEPGGQ